MKRRHRRDDDDAGAERDRVRRTEELMLTAVRATQWHGEGQMSPEGF